jgi:hypothetical protein
MMGNLFKGDDAVIFERAIAVGYFNSLLNVFNHNHTDVRKEGLWGLSNLVADGASNAYRFVESRDLFNKVI